MKKSLFLSLFSVLLAISGPLYARTSLPIDNVRYLVGATVSVADRDDDATIVLTHTTGAKSAHSKDLNDGGWLWGGFLGAEIFVQDFLLGLELHLEEHDFNKGHTFAFTDELGANGFLGHPGEVDYQRGTVLGLTVRAGYQIADWLIGYGRLGVESSRDKLRYNSLYLTGGSTSATAFEQGDKVHRFLAGIGLEFPITCFLSSRLEYVYTSRSNGVQASGLDQLGTYLFEVSAKPNQHALKLSFALHTF